MKLNYFLWNIAFAMLLLLGCSTNLSLEEAHAKAKKHFQNELAKDNVHNAFLHVFSPSQKINWSFVGGQFQNGDAVTAANPFYTASIGKTFTATAIAVLAENGMLKFDDKITRFLPDSIVKNLHMLNQTEYTNEISIAQLLQHTSGLPDYFEGETTDGSANILELLFANPDRLWSPYETIRFAKEKMQPLFAPGTAYHYTDTEYVLLGLIVENVSGMSLHDFFRTSFFEPFDMKNTYMFLRSQPIEETPKTAETYADKTEITTMQSLSADWAGGGLVSTTADLNTFMHALFSGKIISEETLKKMQTWIPETHGMEYGFGLRKISFKQLFPTLPDLHVLGHSGSTGSFLYYCPELDVYLAGTLNQSDEVRSSVVLMVKVLALIQKTQ